MFPRLGKHFSRARAGLMLGCEDASHKALGGGRERKHNFTHFQEEKGRLVMHPRP